MYFILFILVLGFCIPTFNFDNYSLYKRIGWLV